MGFLIILQHKAVNMKALFGTRIVHCFKNKTMSIGNTIMHNYDNAMCKMTNTLNKENVFFFNLKLIDALEYYITQYNDSYQCVLL